MQDSSSSCQDEITPESHRFCDSAKMVDVKYPLEEVQLSDSSSLTSDLTSETSKTHCTNILSCFFRRIFAVEIFEFMNENQDFIDHL